MIGFPLSFAEFDRMRAQLARGERLTATDEKLLLESYEALVLRLSKADMFLHGHEAKTYDEADARVWLERERIYG